MKLFTRCPRVRELQRFLDSDVNQRRAEKISRHVNECLYCQAELDHLTSDIPAFFADLAYESSKQTSLLNLMQRMQSESSPFSQDETRVVGFPLITDPNSDFSGQTVGQYELRELIGSGGSGVVYRAYDPKLDRDVAIKMLRSRMIDEQAIKRMDREAKSVASISHPNIMNVYGFEQAEPDDPSQSPYLVTEYVDGFSLAKMISAGGALDAKWSAEIVRQIAGGLAAAHDQLIIHRDIKPSNILINAQTEVPKIADFGLAIDEDLNSRLTVEGMIAGTPAYMSPEQITNPTSIDRRADIYGLGVVMYECLTGEVPFRGVARATMERILHEPPQDPTVLNSSVHRDLSSICLKAISKNPQRRYQTAEDMADDLTRWLDGKPTIARPISFLEKTGIWARENKLATCLSLLALVLTCALFAGLIQSNQLLSQRAQALKRKSDALLKTVRDVVDKVSDQLEYNELVAPDAVQKSALTISIDGLHAAAESSENNETRLLEAEFQLRLGTVNYRIAEFDDAIKSLTRCVLLVDEIKENSSDTGPNSDNSKKSLSLLRGRANVWRAMAMMKKGMDQRAIESLDSELTTSKSLLTRSQDELLYLDELGIGCVTLGKHLPDFRKAESYLLMTLELAKKMMAIVEEHPSAAIDSEELFYPEFAADKLKSLALMELADRKNRFKHADASKYDFLLYQHRANVAPYDNSLENVDKQLSDDEGSNRSAITAIEYWDYALEMISQNDLTREANLEEIALCYEMIGSLMYQELDFARAKNAFQNAIKFRQRLQKLHPQDSEVFQTLIDARLHLAGVLQSLETNDFETELKEIENEVARWQDENEPASRSKESKRWHARAIFAIDNLANDKNPVPGNEAF